MRLVTTNKATKAAFAVQIKTKHNAAQATVCDVTRRNVGTKGRMRERVNRVANSGLKLRLSAACSPTSAASRENADADFMATSIGDRTVSNSRSDSDAISSTANPPHAMRSGGLRRSGHLLRRLFSEALTDAIQLLGVELTVEMSRSDVRLQLNGAGINISRSAGRPTELEPSYFITSGLITNIEIFHHRNSQSMAVPAMQCVMSLGVTIRACTGPFGIFMVDQVGL